MKKAKMVTPDDSKLICSIEHEIMHCTDSNFIPYTGFAYAMYDLYRIAVKAYFRNGKFYGKTKSYYENGQLKEVGNYKDGELIEISSKYDEQGNLIGGTEYEKQKINQYY